MGSSSTGWFCCWWLFHLVGTLDCSCSNPEKAHLNRPGKTKLIEKCSQFSSMHFNIKVIAGIGYNQKQPIRFFKRTRIVQQQSTFGSSYNTSIICETRFQLLWQPVWYAQCQYGKVYYWAVFHASGTTLERSLQESPMAIKTSD